MSYYACFDIGGTAIKYGLADGRGQFLTTGEVPTEVQTKGVDQIVAKLQGVINEYRQRREVVGVAVATAGMVEPVSGTIACAGNNFPGYTGFPLGGAITQATGLACSVANDVNAFGLGEYWLGSGRGSVGLVCLTFGTGIGGCMLFDGKLIQGSSFSAGEVGYQRIDGESTWEEQASVSALIKKVATAKRVPVATLDGRQIFHLAKAGDKAVVPILQDMVEAWAVGIANICYILNPDRVIVGGGIMAEQAYLEPLLREALKDKLIPYVYDKTQVVFSTMGSKAILAGALYNFLQRH